MKFLKNKILVALNISGLRDKIKKVRPMFEDEYSRNVFDYAVSFYTKKGKSLPDSLVDKYEENFHPKVILKEGDVVVNAGVSSQFIYPLPEFSKAVGSGKVIAFEPDWTITDEIHKNIKKYENENNVRIDNVKIYNYALWNKNKRMKLYLTIPEESASSLMYRIKNNKRHRLHNQKDYIYVDTISYDKFVQDNKIKRTDFIEMDIEGAEFNALKGSKNVIMSQKPNLAISLHKFSDICDITLWVNSLNLGYKFWLGLHSPLTDKYINIIFYASARE